MSEFAAAIQQRDSARRENKQLRSDNYKLRAANKKLQARVKYLLMTDPSNWEPEVIRWLSP